MQGIVHRDLKTNNVFRCAAGDVLKLGAHLLPVYTSYAMLVGGLGGMHV